MEGNFMLHKAAYQHQKNCIKMVEKGKKKKRKIFQVMLMFH